VDKKDKTKKEKKQKKERKRKRTQNNRKTETEKRKKKEMLGSSSETAMHGRVTTSPSPMPVFFYNLILFSKKIHI
jgi:hypothetical protein